MTDREPGSVDLQIVSTPRPTGAVVLVADDSATVRAVARLPLEAAGHRVLEASDGAQALAVLAVEPVDVVLLDVEMPVMDGFQTIARLKADPRTADVPVVFLSGRTGSDDVVRGLELGGHDWLRKPPEPTELLARAAAAARVKALQDELRRRLEALDVASRTDSLTGLHNRRHVQEHITMLTAAARRHRLPLTVLIVDVDHFKRVNDTVGHAGGDLVLQAVAGALAGSVRSEDLVGRWGGEEFLLVLPHTDPEAALVLAERLRARGAALEVVVGGRRVPVTVSIGGAGAVAPLESDLLTLADDQLYAAKDAGRDTVRVVFAKA